jgi:chromosome segregation ATPase
MGLCPSPLGTKPDWSSTVTTQTETTPTTLPTLPELQAEVAHLREELNMRDQLVQQLSQELFRLVKGNASAAPTVELSERQQAELRSLRDQLQGVEEQVTFYQDQITERDTEIHQLRHSMQETIDRAKMLEQVVQELPRVYHEKFEQRMAAVREKVAMIQRENRQLHAELKSANYRLAVRNRQSSQLDLPSFPRLGANSNPIPTFGNI